MTKKVTIASYCVKYNARGKIRRKEDQGPYTLVVSAITGYFETTNNDNGVYTIIVGESNVKTNRAGMLLVKEQLEKKEK